MTGKRLKKYRCSQCGQEKSNHICQFGPLRVEMKDCGTQIDLSITNPHSVRSENKSCEEIDNSPKTVLKKPRLVLQDQETNTSKIYEKSKTLHSSNKSIDLIDRKDSLDSLFELLDNFENASYDGTNSESGDDLSYDPYFYIFCEDWTRK